MNKERDRGMKDARNIAGRAIPCASAMKKLSQTAREIYLHVRAQRIDQLFFLFFFSFLISHHYRALSRDARSHAVKSQPWRSLRKNMRGWMGRGGKAVLYARIQI